MELAYAIIFFIFIFNWFSRYNFISFILFITSCNIIRNVRVYMIKNQIDNPTNPFLRIIKWSGDTAIWIGQMVRTSNSTLCERFGFIRWLELKYTELNNHFLELLSISKKQTTEQFASGFNYTLNTVLAIPPALPAQQISSKSSKTINQENSIYLPLINTVSTVLQISTKLKPQQMTNKVQEEINAIKTIIKDLDTKILSSQKIDLYDSDSDVNKDKTE